MSHVLVVQTRSGALEETLETRKKRIAALEPQVESMDAEINAKVGLVVSSVGHVRTGEEGKSLMSATICEHGHNHVQLKQLVPWPK